MKYKIGDKVKIRTDLKGDHHYTTEKGLSLYCAHQMTKYKGKIYTIDDVERSSKIYYLEEIKGWVWCAEMFESIQEENEL